MNNSTPPPPYTSLLQIVKLFNDLVGDQSTHSHELTCYLFEMLLRDIRLREQEKLEQSNIQTEKVRFPHIKRTQSFYKN